MKNLSYIAASIILLCNLTIDGSDNESFDPKKSPFSFFYLEDQFITPPQTVGEKGILYPTETGWQLCSPAEFNTELHNEYAKAKNQKAYLQKLEKYGFVTAPICPPTRKRKVEPNNLTPSNLTHFVAANTQKNACKSPAEFNATSKEFETNNESFDPKKSPFSFFYLEDQFITHPQTVDEKGILYPTETGWQLCSPAKFNTELHNEYAKAKNQKAYLQKLEKYRFVTAPICPPTKKGKVQPNNLTPSNLTHLVNDDELNEALNNLNIDPLAVPSPHITNTQSEKENINHDRKDCPAEASKSSVCKTIPLQESSTINMQAIITKNLTDKKL